MTTADRKYLTPNGLVDRDGFIRYLKASLERWRGYPATTKEAIEARDQQAARVEAKIARFERGEEDDD